MTTALLGFVAAMTLIFLRVPIAISLALTGILGLTVEYGFYTALIFGANAMRDTSMTYTLSVIPLFILMGNLIGGAGLSQKIFNVAATSFLGRRKGGIAMATIASCGGFGAVCGSSVATAATMGKVAVPAMRSLGYSDKLSTASVVAGGTLGVLIPPSIIMVIYGISTQTHIGKLFAAGLLPGLIAILFYLVAVRWVVWRDPSSGPKQADNANTAKTRYIRDLWPAIILFTTVIGGIYGGVFTATEAAGIGASLALLYALFNKSLKIKDINKIFLDTALTSAALIFLVIGASIFSEFINITGIHRSLKSMITGDAISPTVVILTIILVYIILGAFLESISVILLTVPIFFPVVMSLGLDPVWFGVIVVVATEVGLITPPIGVNLFVIKSVAKDIKMSTIISGTVPFIFADILRLFVLAAFPVISLWLPSLLFT